MKLKYAVKLAAIKAAYTQLGVTTQPSASVTAGIFQVQRLEANIQTLNRIVASAQEGNFMLFAALFDTFYIRDGAGASDAAVFDFFKTLTDDAGVAEEANNSFRKSLAHTAAFGDSIYSQRAYRRGFFHTTATADNALFGVGKPLSDASGTLDSRYVVTGKHISDMPAATDTLVVALTGQRSDSALFGDASDVAFNKTLLELASTADAGSVRIQSYSGSTYFGEDYVGASRTF